MNVTKIATAPLKLNLYPHQLRNIISELPLSIKTLSFDCFDTLIWRQVADPKDVFYNLNQISTKQINYTLRTLSENAAYALNKIKKNQSQSTLDDIYAHAVPLKSAEERQDYIKNEISAELETCYAFMPMVEFLKAAKKRNMNIIIVSDTYLTQKQLKLLLSEKLPHDVYAMIDEIYCSCDHGVAKHESLFKKIIDQRNIIPASLLHIGDNLIADSEIPSKYGIHTIRFNQYSGNMAEIIRMQSIAAPFLDASIRTTRGLNIPFKPLYAGLSDEQAPTLVGYATVGPLLLAFSRYVHQIYLQEKQQHKSVKVLYLLRDGYLPHLAMTAYLNESFGHLVRISRFSAFASSFRSIEDIDNYLATRIESKRYKEICKQLQIPADKTEQIIRKSLEARQPNLVFNEMIHRKVIIDIIIKKSTEYRHRLYQYLRKQIQLEQHDTLIFVDLGYTGTTQIQLAPVFKEELDVDIIGCYLISLQTSDRGLKRSGLLSGDHYDHKSLTMLVTYIALLEQICTSTDKSVIDFNDAGEPIYSDSVIDLEQADKIRHIQTQVISFIHDAKKIIVNQPILLTDRDYRDLAGINLMRLLYLPTKIENEYFSTIRHDVNLGTDDVIPLLDVNLGLNNLRRRGWLHSLKEPSTHTRMNYPAEWRAISIDLSIVLMAQHRHEFKISTNDSSQRDILIPIVLQSKQDTTMLDLPATPTYDGYYALIIPIPENGAIGIQLGQVFKCIQLHQIEKIKLAHLYSRKEIYFTENAEDNISFDKMTLRHQSIVDVLSSESLMIYQSRSTNQLHEDEVLRIIFRPLVFQSQNENITV